MREVGGELFVRGGGGGGVGSEDGAQMEGVEEGRRVERRPCWTRGRQYPVWSLNSRLGA